MTPWIDDYTIFSGSVSAGSDYQPVEKELVFAPGDERQCFEVQIMVDQLDEEREEFLVLITSASDRIDINEPTSSSTISILDGHGQSD